MHIHHIAIWTRDLERLRAFYQTYFTATSGPLYANPAKNYASYFLKFADGASLELMANPAIPSAPGEPLEQFTGLTHFALSTGSAEEVDRLTHRLEQDGYTLVSAPRTTGDGYYESVVLDPDGNRIEITI